MTVLSDALGMTGAYDTSLSGATEQLSSASGREQIKTIVEALPEYAVETHNRVA